MKWDWGLDRRPKQQLYYKICPKCNRKFGSELHLWVYELCPECKAKERKQDEEANRHSN